MHMPSRSRLRLVVAVLLCCAASSSVACSGSAASVTDEARSPADEERLRDEEATIDERLRDEEAAIDAMIDTTQIPREDGSTILAQGTFEATVEIAPLAPPGAKLADEIGIWLRVATPVPTIESTRWLLIAGGPDDWSELDGQTVRVSGRVVELDPYSAHLGVPHFEADAVELVEAGGGTTTFTTEAEAALTEAELEQGYETTYADELDFFDATVRIDAEPGGKMFQGVWLEPDGGGSLLVSYRKTPEWAAWEGQRVEIAGRRSYPGRLTQHVMAQHFKVEHVDAAPAHAPTFTGEAETHEGVVRLSSGEGKKTTLVTLELGDGTSVLLRYGTTPVWDGLDGKRVRLTGRPFEPGHPQQVSGAHLWPDQLVVLD